MKKKTIGLIVGLMTFALLGVMAMQYFFIRQSYIQQSLLFDESVKAAISNVASKAEKKEVLEYSRTIQQKNKERDERQRNLEKQLHLQEELESVRNKLTARQKHYKDQEENMLRVYPHAVYIDNVFYETYINNPENNHLVSIDFGIHQAGLGGGLVQGNYIEVKALKAVPQASSKDDSVRFVLLRDINPYTRSAINDIVALPPKTDRTLEERYLALEQEIKLMQAGSFTDTIAILGGKNTRLIEDFAISSQLSKKPLVERIDIEFIKNELQHELSEREIHSPFVLELREDSGVLYSFAAFDSTAETGSQAYSTPLFKEDLDRTSAQLAVYFPNKNKILMGNVAMMLASSVALLLVLAGAFAYTIRTILRQKKISEMKTDFINNMTHEFKTPVATIMIASESLKDPDIVEDRSRISRLAGIIYDENVRLGNHIERVLNIARIEKEDLRMAQEDVYINDLLQIVVDSMELQFQKHGVKLEMGLDAKEDLVTGDELHLSNVVFNLLDNALKYSKENPEIRIQTRNTQQGIVITVADKGIGMNKDQLSRIFEQFYRVPTGNLHDVKGFGLGLSYVSDIVKRMKGKVSVKSEKGKGTVFEVFLPLK